MAYINEDGLQVKYGLDEVVPSLVTEYTTDGPKRLVEILIDADNAPAVADGSVVISYGYVIPAGAVIGDVTITPTGTFTGTSTLNIGVTDLDGGTDLTDVDALVAAATVAELNAGGTNTAGWIGTLPGTVLTEAVHLTWEVDTAAIADGKASIRFEWEIPKQIDDTLVWNKS